jgi:hypothetical protein
MGVFGYIDLTQLKESSPEAWQIPNETLCMTTKITNIETS